MNVWENEYQGFSGDKFRLMEKSPLEHCRAARDRWQAEAPSEVQQELPTSLGQLIC